MFKSEDHEQGCKNLLNDYDTITSVSYKLVTRLSENAVDTLIEQLYNEIYDCFDEEFMDKAQAFMEEKGTDGYIDGFLDAVNNLSVRYLDTSSGFTGEEGWYFGITPVGPYATEAEAKADIAEQGL